MMWVRILTCSVGLGVEYRCCGFCYVGFGVEGQWHVDVACAVSLEELRLLICGSL